MEQSYSPVVTAKQRERSDVSDAEQIEEATARYLTACDKVRDLAAVRDRTGTGEAWAAWGVAVVRAGWDAEHIEHLLWCAGWDAEYDHRAGCIWLDGRPDGWLEFTAVQLAAGPEAVAS